MAVLLSISCVEMNEGESGRARPVNGEQKQQLETESARSASKRALCTVPDSFDTRRVLL